MPCIMGPVVFRYVKAYAEANQCQEISSRLQEHVQLKPYWAAILHCSCDRYTTWDHEAPRDGHENGMPLHMQSNSNAYKVKQ